MRLAHESERVPAQQPEQAQVSEPVPAWVPAQAVVPALQQEQVSVPEQPEPQRHSKHPPRQSPFRRAPSHRLARESR
jgi:hypothetical protein